MPRSASFVPYRLIGLLAMGSVLLVGCSHLDRRNPLTNVYEKPKLGIDATDDWQHTLQRYRDLEVRERVLAASHVHIEGGDIRVPPTLEPAERLRTYDFYVWFNESAIKGSAFEALRNGLVTVDVSGTEATFSPVTYSDEGANRASAAPASRSLIRVSVPYTKDLASFDIIAYIGDRMDEFERTREERVAERAAECRREPRPSSRSAAGNASPSAEASRVVDGKSRAPSACEELYARLYQKNPFLEVRHVRVFNGDLTTRIYMLSLPEVENAFGRAFANAFYVGKTYFHNNNGSKRLIVHTTSLRARTVFARNGATRTSARLFDPDYPKGYLPPENHSQAPYRSEIRCLEMKLLANPNADPSKVEIAACLKPVGGEDDRTATTASPRFAALERLVQDVHQALDKWRYTAVPTPPAKSSRAEEYTNLLSRSFATLSPERQLNCAKQIAARRLDSSSREFNDCFLAGTAEMDVQKRLRSYQTQAGRDADDNAKAAKAVQDGIAEQINASVQQAIAASTIASPLALDLRRRVGLTHKVGATSADMTEQEWLSEQGYFWEDYYRPMTFESVLLSLTAETRNQPSEKILRWMESAGVVFAGLVGLGDISAKFDRPGFAQRVAFTTGVLLPEARKLFGKDVAQYLNNLATNALPSVLTLDAHQSRDGYVFFPRGPIFGYGVDEFLPNLPSYIVNIDNEDVAVDGEVIADSVSFESGYKKPEDQISEGKALIGDPVAELLAMQEKMERTRIGFAVEDMCRLLAAGKAVDAKKRLDAYRKTDAAARKGGKADDKGDDGIIGLLSARIDSQLDCNGNPVKPAAVSDASSAAGGKG